MTTKGIAVSIARARHEDVPVVHEFHRNQATEFIWPRTLNELGQLADEGSLLVARANDASTQSNYIVGMCYVMEGKELDGERRWEFGGVCVSSELRGYGLASALGVAAISSLSLYEPPQRGERLSAHVHIDNKLPRHMLEVQLGFIQVGQETPPSEVIPPVLRRNSRGEVVGDLYEFQISTLDRLADWLEAFDGWVEGRNGCLATSLNLEFFQAYCDTAIQILRESASSSKAD